MARYVYRRWTIVHVLGERRPGGEGDEEGREGKGDGEGEGEEEEGKVNLNRTEEGRSITVRDQGV